MSNPNITCQSGRCAGWACACVCNELSRVRAELAEVKAQIRSEHDAAHDARELRHEQDRERFKAFQEVQADRERLARALEDIGRRAASAHEGECCEFGDCHCHQKNLELLEKIYALATAKGKT